MIDVSIVLVEESSASCPLTSMRWSGSSRLQHDVLMSYSSSTISTSARASRTQYRDCPKPKTSVSYCYESNSTFIVEHFVQSIWIYDGRRFCGSHTDLQLFGIQSIEFRISFLWNIESIDKSELDANGEMDTSCHTMMWAL